MRRARKQSPLVSWRRAFRRVIVLGVIAGALFGATQSLADATGTPTISGVAQQGQTLSLTQAMWPLTTSVSDQWQSCTPAAVPVCTNVGTGTLNYEPTSSDVGNTIDVVETGVDLLTGSSSVMSNVVGPVLPPVPTIASLPAAPTGTAEQGNSLTADNGTWNNSPASFDYQWQRCDGSGAACVSVGSDQNTYALGAGDVAHTIRVLVTASNAAGPSAAAQSAATAVVVAPAPTIASLPAAPTGTAEQGNSLTADNGTWNNSPTSFGYQWQRCNGSGAACVSVGSDQNTYALGAGDVAHTIRVLVTASNAAGPSAAAQSAATAVVVPPAPTNNSPPTILGKAQQGVTLSEFGDTWNNSPTSHDYQWEDCNAGGSSCSPTGTDSSSYSLSASDVGQTIRVVETATNAGGTSAPVTSSASSVVLPPAPTNTSPPAILGVAQQGHTLSEGGDTWTGNPGAFAFQWQDCDTTGNSCSPIIGATSATYALTANDVGQTLRVVESATNTGGTSQARSAASSTVVAASAQTPPPATASVPANTAAPTVTGSAVAGMTLHESRGQWTNSPTGYTNQWVRCDTTGAACVSVVGATSQTFKLTTADVGHTIRVSEIASNAAGAGAPVFSTATAKVSVAPKHKPATAAQVKAMLSAQLRPVGATAVLGRGGFAVPFTAIAPGTLVEQWYRVPLGAKAAAEAAGDKPVLVASGTLKFTKPGTATITVRPTPAGKLAFKAASLLLAAKGTFTGSGSRSVSATATTTVVVRHLVPAGHQVGVYHIPTVGAGPTNIVGGSKGGLWFTESGSGRIGFITPAGKVTEHSIGKPKASPQGLTVGPAGDIWFADDGTDSIGTMTRSGAVAEYPIRSDPSAHPTSIAPGPGHTMLFTATGSAKIGSIDTRTHAIREYALPNGFSTPANIVSGAHGLDYFDAYDNLGHVLAIGTITAKGAIAVYRFEPHSYVGPYPGSLALGSNPGRQTVVFTLDDGNKSVAEYNTVTGARRYFPYPSGSLQGQGLTVATDGTVWYTTKGSGKVTHLNPDTGKTTQFATKPATTEPDGIAQGPLGEIWFLDWQANAIFSITGGICPVSACVRVP